MILTITIIERVFHMYTTVDTGTLKVTTERGTLRELTFLCFYLKNKNDRNTLSTTKVLLKYY